MKIAIENTQPRVYSIGDGLVLNPGINATVDKKAWEEAKKIEVVKILIAEGKLAEITPKEAEKRGTPEGAGDTGLGGAQGQGSAPAIRLTDLKPAEATDMVKKTFDRAVLQAWEKEEKLAASVKSAIEKQYELLQLAGGDAAKAEANAEAKNKK